MADTSSRSRVAKGLRTGGQFAAEHRAEATGVSLSPAQSLSEMGPEQIDEKLAELYGQRLRTIESLHSQLERLHVEVGDRQTGRGQHRVWQQTDQEVVELARQLVTAQDPRRGQVEKPLERIGQHQAALTVMDAESEPYEAEYASRPWPRFFAVPGGHIHSSMDCSTCNHNGTSTRFGWLPKMSGRTEADVVTEHGALLCTVCYPSAPVEWTNHYALEEQQKATASCPGSGTDYDPNLPHRTGYAAGNWAACPECSEKVTITSAGRLRKHKRA